MLRIVRLEGIEWSGVLCEVNGEQTILYEGTWEACQWVLDHQIVDHMKSITFSRKVVGTGDDNDLVHRLMLSDYKMKKKYAQALVAHWRSIQPSSV